MVTATTEDVRSLAEKLSVASDEVRKKFYDDLTDEEARALMYDWEFWGRTNQQVPPGDWLGWFIMTGRGWGKNRTAVETLRQFVSSGRTRVSAVIGRTAADVRDVMVEGPDSGLLAICPDGERPRWEPSRRKLIWPNGAVTKTYSAEEPDRLRGPQHDFVWGDEVAAWRFREAWDNAMLGLRLMSGGHQPSWLATSTPKPRPLIREFLKRVEEGTVVLTTGSTYENKPNLAPAFIEQIVKRLEGTRLSSQELYGQLITTDPNALWKPEVLEANRVLPSEVPPLVTICGAVDPQVKFTEDDEGTETGMVFGGVGQDGLGYLLSDVSMRGSPGSWARQLVDEYRRLKADKLVAEANSGGDMVIATITGIDPLILVKKIIASRDKRTRAEPVAVLYDRGLIKHVGYFAELESQMCTWVPGEKSPDRMDALVWLMTELMGQQKVYGRDYRIDGLLPLVTIGALAANLV